jgi:hypothetical protein
MMVSMYDSQLPRAGLQCIFVKIGPARQIVEFLIEADETCSNGSSWAVTTDCAAGYRKIWLSRASIQRLIRDFRFRPMRTALQEMLRSTGMQ